MAFVRHCETRFADVVHHPAFGVAAVTFGVSFLVTLPVVLFLFH